MPMAPALEKDGFPAPKAPVLNFAPFHVQPATGQTLPHLPFSLNPQGHQLPSQSSQHPPSSAPEEAGVGTAQHPSLSVAP